MGPVCPPVLRCSAACLRRLEEAATVGCELVVFTECVLSGYMLSSRAEAEACAEPVPGPSTEAFAAACARLGLHCSLGLLERDGDLLRNTCVLVGPDGIVGRYRKSHTACVGADCFTTPGSEPYEVYETPLGKIGLQICCDWRFPEITRVLALRGADVIVRPTNSTVASRELAEFLPRARAAENAVYLLLANRVGVEGGSRFFGHSQVVDPLGTSSRREAAQVKRSTSRISTLSWRARRRKSQKEAATLWTCSATGGPSSTGPSGSRRPSAAGAR